MINRTADVSSRLKVYWWNTNSSTGYNYCKLQVWHSTGYNYCKLHVWHSTDYVDGTFINTGIQAHVSNVGQQMFLLDLRCIDRIPIVQQVILTLPVCRGRDRMVVGFTANHAISAYHYWCCEFESWSGRGVPH